MKNYVNTNSFSLASELKNLLLDNNAQLLDEICNEILVDNDFQTPNQQIAYQSLHYFILKYFECLKYEIMPTICKEPYNEFGNDGSLHINKKYAKDRYKHHLIEIIKDIVKNSTTKEICNEGRLYVIDTLLPLFPNINPLPFFPPRNKRFLR